MPSTQATLKQALVTLAVMAIVSFAARRVPAVAEIVAGPALV